MAKKNNGKSLEKTIRLIQETFKDSENTQVFPSCKLTCQNGLEREFDVLIKSKVNDFEICIAIECKDYGSKVSVDRIESFNSKCSTIKEINKKVFVSANGYQSGAIVQAKNFGIELLTAEQVSKEYLKELMPNVSPLYLELIKDNFEHKISIGTDENFNLQEAFESYKNKFIDSRTGIEQPITELMKMIIKAKERDLEALALKHYVTFKNSLDINSSFDVALSMEVPKLALYYEDKNLCKVYLIRLDFEITIKLNKIETQNTGRIIKDIDDSIKAHSIIMKINDDIENEMILKPDNEFSFYHTSNNETVEFKTLTMYDPVTKQITIYND